MNARLGMYYTPEGGFKLFDSNARDLFGMPHPQGTCVLLELDPLNELLNYFLALCTISNALFELKGVHISEMCYSTSSTHFSRFHWWKKRGFLVTSTPSSLGLYCKHHTNKHGQALILV